MIDRYLDRGRMYALEDGGILCECVVTDEGSGLLEIKNLAYRVQDENGTLACFMRHPISDV